MANTYAFNIRPYQTVWSQDIANTVGFMGGSAAFAIYNHGSSGKIVKVKQIDVFGNSPGAVLTGGAAELVRTTGYVAGGGRAATHNAMDTNNAVPSGVDIYSNPVEVTATSDIVRKICAIPLAMTTIGLPGAGRQMPSYSEIYDRQAGTSAPVQPITLNQNQGLALNIPGNCTPMAYGVMIRYSYGGNTFTSTTEVSAVAEFPLWSIFNSNATPVYVERITVIEIGLAVQNKFAVEFIDVMDTDTGEVEDVVPMDTDAPLPATIFVKTGPRVTKAGFSQGASVSVPLVRSPAWFHMAQNANIMFNQTMEQATKASMFGQSGSCEAILRPGKGIAVYERMGANIGLPAFRGFFTVEDIPTGGGVAPVARSYVG